MSLNFLSRFISPPPQIGVIGSLGKTSTVLAIEIALKDHNQVKVSKLSLPTKLKPEMVVVTNAFDLQNDFPTHLLVEKYSNLTSQLPKNASLILNWDDADCRILANSTQAEVIFYGTEMKKCHVWAGNVRIYKSRVVFEINYGVERIEVNTNFVSKHQIYSLLAATAVGLHKGLRLTQLKSNLEKIYPLKHKLEVLPGFEGSTLIDDSFDGLVATTESAIETLNNLTARRRILVLGQMQQLGRPAEKIYHRIAQKIYKDKIDLVLLGKGEVEIVADELLNLGFTASRLKQNLTNPQIVTELLQILEKGDVVLLKSSIETRFDEVVAKIAKK